ncbi:hypothetical protein MUTS15_30070 [Escherichia coli]|nr:hypothetical protein MUTS15_30070 [Escherichia coli]
MYVIAGYAHEQDSVASGRAGGANHRVRCVYCRSGPSGRRGITSLLNRSASILKHGADAADYPWEQLNYAAVAKVRAALLDDGYAVSSVNMALSALRGVAQTAFNLNYMDAETLARIRSVKRVSGDVQRKGRALGRQEIRVLIQAAKQHPQSVRRCRDVAIVLMLCGTGLRAGELVKLERRDYDNGILTVRQGKGVNTVKFTWRMRWTRLFVRG